MRDWAEQLAGLAVDEGISTFVLGTDDPDLIRTFGLEVAPAVRDQVDDRARLCAPRAARPSARRRPPGPGRSDRGHTHPATGAAVRRGACRGTSRPDPAYPAPADATYTEAQQAYPQHLVDIHDALRAELDQLRDVVDQVRRGLMQVGQARSVINTMTMRQNNWTLGAYCESYCRIVTGHHTLEDRSMLPFLRQRDPEAAPVVDRLVEEHEVIAEVLERVDRALVELVGAEPREASDRLEQLSAQPSTCSPTPCSRTCPTRSASCCTRWRRTGRAESGREQDLVVRAVGRRRHG